MKYIRMFLLFLVLFVLTGCWDEDENVRMLYVHGVGIDYDAQEDEFHLYVQVISFITVAKSEEINQDAMQSEVGFAKGKSIDEALTELYRTADEKLFYGHLTFLILKEDLLKHGKLNDVLNPFTRFSDTRYQTWIYATDQPLEPFFIETPILKKAISLTSLANPLNSFSQDSYIAPIDMRQLIIELNEPNHLANIPYIKIKENWNTEKGVDPAFQFDGVALVTPKGFHGYIKGEDANGFRWLTNETVFGLLSAKVDGNNILLTIKNLKTNVVPIIDGPNLQFDINISVITSLESFGVDLKESEIQEAVKSAMKKEILKTYKKGLENNCDVYRLSETLYREQVKLWKMLEKDGTIPLTEDSIRNINVHVERVEAGRKNYKNTINEP